MHTVAAWAFWLSVGMLLYIYGGFAVLVAAVGSLRRRTVRSRPVTPTISLIIAAHNEEAVIGARLDNARALEYPADRLEILVAADGCTDATEAIVGRCPDARVTLLSLPRLGKLRALDAAVARATGDILVFSDANIVCHPLAVRALARNFADPEVGGVAGHTRYRQAEGSESSSEGESLYWDYDTWLKQLESCTGSVVSAHGGLYAIRRRLYRPVTDPAVTDDFAISTEVIQQGCRLVFEPDAQATEFTVPEAQREFRRRVRLMTRGLRGVVLRRRLLNPFRFGFYAIVLFSHKVLRRLAPVCLVAIAAASAYLAASGGGRFYRAAVVAQALFYLVALAGLLLRRAATGRLKLVCIPFYYCMANTACALALVHLVRG